MSMFSSLYTLSKVSQYELSGLAVAVMAASNLKSSVSAPSVLTAPGVVSGTSPSLLAPSVSTVSSVVYVTSLSLTDSN